MDKEHQFDQMFDRLFTVKDMQMVMIIDKDGKVTACSSDVNDKKNYFIDNRRSCTFQCSGLRCRSS